MVWLSESAEVPASNASGQRRAVRSASGGEVSEASPVTCSSPRTPRRACVRFSGVRKRKHALARLHFLADLGSGGRCAPRDAPDRLDRSEPLRHCPARLHLVGRSVAPTFDERHSETVPRSEKPPAPPQISDPNSSAEPYLRGRVFETDQTARVGQFRFRGVRARLEGGWQTRLVDRAEVPSPLSLWRRKRPATANPKRSGASHLTHRNAAHSATRPVAFLPCRGTGRAVWNGRFPHGSAQRPGAHRRPYPF